MRSTYSKYAVISVFRFFKIRYTADYVQKMLEENSDGDNLWGILTVLKIYGLIVEPCRITNQLVTEENGISLPFLTEYENNILLIKKIAGNTVFGCTNGKDTMYRKEDFFKNWNGIMVSIHKGESVGEPNIKKHLRNNQYIWLSRIAIALSLLTICIYRLAFFNMPFYICNIFILSVLGAIISYQIEVSHYSPNGLMNNLCSLIKYSSCNQMAVGKSRYITAIGFSYFCSLCAFILLSLNNYAMTICIMSISSIEVLWSLFTQLKKHEFCISCMAVQIIVIIMMLIGFFNLTKLHLHDFIQQGILFLSIFAIIFSISIFKIWPYIASQYKFKVNSRMLDYFKKKYLDNTTTEESTIKIFLNPFCSPCKEEFMTSYNLIINLGQSKVIPIIIASGLKGEKAGMSIINGGKATSIFHRLKEWYSWGYLSLKDFERKYKVSTNDETKLIGVLKDNLNLAHTYNVQHTPSIIHNGIKLSTGVSLVDVLTQ